MIDFPIDELLDEVTCAAWLERHLHPEGLTCPRCAHTERRVARRGGPFLGYRCTRCDRYHTILTGTVFEKTHQRPSQLVLFLRGVAKGESTARLSRELARSRGQTHTLRRRVAENLFRTLPSAVREDAVEFEADELYQNAGEKKQPAPRPQRPAQTARK